MASPSLSPSPLARLSEEDMNIYFADVDPLTISLSFQEDFDKLNVALQGYLPSEADEITTYRVLLSELMTYDERFSLREPFKGMVSQLEDVVRDYLRLVDKHEVASCDLHEIYMLEEETLNLKNNVYVFELERQSLLDRHEEVRARINLLMDKNEAIRDEMSRLILELSTVDDELKGNMDREIDWYTKLTVFNDKLKLLLPRKKILQSALKKIKERIQLKRDMWDNLRSSWQQAKISMANQPSHP
jgi:hypothetical protein